MIVAIMLLKYFYDFKYKMFKKLLASTYSEVPSLNQRNTSNKQINR